MARPKAPFELSGPGGKLLLPPDDAEAIDLAMLIAGETSGRPLDDVLAEFGRSRSTYYEKLKRFREQGLQGLRPSRPGPRKPWLRTEEMIRHIIALRMREPGSGAPAIAEQLARDGHSVSVRSIERTLSQFGLTRTREGEGE